MNCCDLLNLNVTEFDSPELRLTEILGRLANLKFIFYSCLIVATIASNSRVIYLVLRQKLNFRRWRLNLFIVQLAVAGLLVSMTTMPATLIAIPTNDEWMFSEKLCKARALIQVVAPASTSFLLVSMAIDRYYAIVQNTRHQHQNFIMVSTSWLLSILLSLPQLYGFGLIEREPGNFYCEAKSSWIHSLVFPFYLATVFLCVVIIPTGTNAFCYGRALYYLYGANRFNVPVRNSVAETKNLILQRENSIKLAIAIVLSYFGCWLPYFVGAFLVVFCNFRPPEWFQTVTEGLAMLNSLINPLLCCWYSIGRKNYLIEKKRLNERQQNRRTTSNT